MWRHSLTHRILQQGMGQLLIHEIVERKLTAFWFSLKSPDNSYNDTIATNIKKKIIIIIIIKIGVV